ncbi:MAG: serine protease [Clostridia bacterium]|nr:serine protease [Clostridia bacterium]
MRYLKYYEKRKNKGHLLRTIILIFAIVIGIEIWLINTNRLESEDLKISEFAENNIEFASKFVVGISKENVILTGNTSSWGSGIIVSKEGYIVTNAHVCGNKDEVCYVIYDYDEVFSGVVVWSNSEIDLAIVKTNVKYSDCINLGDSNKINLSQDIYCIGNPIGPDFSRSVSKGIISGKNRNLEFVENNETYYMTGLIQIDAAINYGNSGGALVDSLGNLIGINTIKISSSDSMGFAVPINVIIPIINSYNEKGDFKEPSLKILGYDKYSISSYNPQKHINNGVLIANVESNSNAEKSGLKSGDIITHIDTDEIKSVMQLREVLYSKNIGDNIIVKVVRNNSEMLINTKVQEH